MVKTEQLHNVFFIGIGGIGMSALARYFKATGKNITGYDRVETQITRELQQEGIEIHFTDDVNQIPPSFKNSDDTWVIYTPAIPGDHQEMNFFRDHGFNINKRAEVLGSILHDKKGIAVAGTHGKTTVSSMTAYLLHTSDQGCSAFLGGIVKNFNSNFIISSDSDLVVAEADEYDRSFLHLHPWIGIVTAMDADHLDIYGHKNDLTESFQQFVNQIVPGGYLLHKHGLEIGVQKDAEVNTYTYSLDNTQADFYAFDISLSDGIYTFHVQTPQGRIRQVSLQQKGLINVENAVAAIAAASLSGVESMHIEKCFKDYLGIRRRFDVQINNPELVFIDDYAHHPQELEAVIGSVRDLYPGKQITGVFQPHLYSRTRDFADEFAVSLSKLDELILLDIYPAREVAIPGVSSKLIYDQVTLAHKKLIRKEELLNMIKQQKNIQVLLTLGAGDIDKEVEPIRQYLTLQSHEH